MIERGALTQAVLKRFLRYEPETGLFIRLVKTSPKVEIGDVAGGLDRHGHRIIRVGKTRYMAHRLAWLYMTGHWPLEEIDHKNGLRDDNRFDNLREASTVQNRQNLLKHRDSESGFLGVSWHSQARKWSSRIHTGGKRFYLGLFDTKEDAYAAYLAAKAVVHPFQPVPRQVD